MHGKRLSVGLIVGALLFLLESPSARARPQLSDVTGAILTTSDIIDGGLPGQEGRTTFIVYRTDQIAVAVNQAAASVNQQLAARTLPAPAIGVPTTSLSPGIQLVLESVLTQTGNVNANANQLANGLFGNCAGVGAGRAEELAANLVGLTAGGQVEAAQLGEAVSAFNEVVNAADDSCLSDPPEELLAIQSALAQLLEEAFEAAQQ
jgi:hypothetical protein